jgi:hypothetical protein
MTVKELIDQLSKFPDDMEVTVADGFGCHFYNGKFEVKEFDGEVDIGVGGTEIA